jgi:hypothetical protein
MQRRSWRGKGEESRSQNQHSITNSYLHFENIRQAAFAGDFTVIHIGYFRNEQLLAARAEKNQGRLNFIAWAVVLLRARAPASIDQEALLAAWDAVPKAERDTITTASAKAFFRAVGRVTVRLTMEELRARVQNAPPKFALESWARVLQAGVQAGLPPSAGACAGGAQVSASGISVCS